jgi:hypothetical protein
MATSGAVCRVFKPAVTKAAPVAFASEILETVMVSSLPDATKRFQRILRLRRQPTPAKESQYDFHCMGESSFHHMMMSMIYRSADLRGLVGRRNRRVRIYFLGLTQLSKKSRLGSGLKAHCRIGQLRNF